MVIQSALRHFLLVAAVLACLLFVWPELFEGVAMQSQQVHFPTSTSTSTSSSGTSAPVEDKAARCPSPPPPSLSDPQDCSKCVAEKELSQPRILEVIVNEESYELLLSSLAEDYLANKALEFCVERLKLGLDEAVAKCQDPVRSHLLKEAEAIRKELRGEAVESKPSAPADRRLFREGGRDFLKISITGRGEYVLSLDGEVVQVAESFCREHAEDFALATPAELSACTLAIRDHIDLVLKEELELQKVENSSTSSSVEKASLQPEEEEV